MLAQPCPKRAGRRRRSPDTRAPTAGSKARPGQGGLGDAAGEPLLSPAGQKLLCAADPPPPAARLQAAWVGGVGPTGRKASGRRQGSVGCGRIELRSWLRGVLHVAANCVCPAWSVCVRLSGATTHVESAWQCMHFVLHAARLAGVWVTVMLFC